LKYKDNYYTFNTRDAAYSFAENPEHYINLIKEKAKKNAELIQLLELHQQFETLVPYSQVSRVSGRRCLTPAILATQEDHSSKPARANSSQDPILKIRNTKGAGGVPKV
jgi:hypothetical protein